MIACHAWNQFVIEAALKRWGLSNVDTTPVLDKPVVFLAFANDQDHSQNYLRKLNVEARRLREVLESAEGLCELVVRANSTAGDIFRVLQDPKYRNRIAIFHYGGHANGYQLLLESATGEAAAADAGGLAAFFAQQRGLRLVFLNGCSTRKQTQGLLDAGIPAVISTAREIDDAVATDFACQFYQGIAGGTNIRTAYNEAEASIQTSKGGNTRDLHIGKPGEAESEPEADRWPWNLYLRDGAETADQWNLPQAVGDPLFGLPPLPEQDLPESPYRHLNWFTRKDAEVFFGRGYQIRELYDRLTAPRTAPIMLLYGQSGVGKSSLLDAGLIPRLERDYQVRYLRRTADGLLATLQQSFLIEQSEHEQVKDAQPAAKPVVEFLEDVEQLYARPGAAAPKVHEQLMPPPKDTPIAAAWRQQEENTGKPLIVFLDQVEELYTHPDAALPDELQQFLGALEDIFADPNRRPKGKLVLGFRKEWLAELEAHLVEHGLPRTKVFLEPLDRRGVMEVVRGPTQSKRLRDHYRLIVDKELPEIIADDLLEDRASAVAPTLQILLTKLWSKAREENSEKPQFDQTLYQGLKRDGILMRDFLEQQIAKFRERFPDAVDSGLLLDILALHTTALGTAGQCSLADLQQQYAHQGARLPELLQQCQDLHLLTVAAGARQEGQKTTRLAHDTLAPLVRERFDVSDLPGQRARRILDNRSVDWTGERESTPLDEADLAVVERGFSGTRALNSTEQRLVEASRQERARAERNRKRWRYVGVAAVALILFAGAFGWLKSIEANNKSIEANWAKRKTTELIIQVAFKSFDREAKEAKNGGEEELTCAISENVAAFGASKKSLAGLVCYIIDNIVNMGDLQRISNLQIFLSGPHQVNKEIHPIQSYSNTAFGHYNPEFVEWAFSNLIPSSEILTNGGATWAVYDEYISDQARIFYQVYRDLHVDQGELEKLTRSYESLIKTYQGDESEDNKSPGTYAQERFDLYASIMLEDSISAETLSDPRDAVSPGADENDVRTELFRRYYRYRTAGAFWLRRELDGSASQFFGGLEKVLRAFDPEFLKNPPAEVSPAERVRNYLVNQLTIDRHKIDFAEDGTYSAVDEPQQGKWRLPELDKLFIDDRESSPCEFEEIECPPEPLMLIEALQ